MDGKGTVMPTFGFVVLHYLVDDATTQCVESIRRHCAGGDYHVVVVDNNSANGSYERLREPYAGTGDVTLLHNAANEGFARGNNTGYRYCKEQLHCEYIVTINNDAMLAGDDFMTLCIEDYQRTHCGVIGPDIVSLKDGRHQNPSYGIIRTHEEVRRQLRRFHRILLLLRLHLYAPLVRLKQRLRGQAAAPSPYTHATAEADTNRPYKLHGACLIFTPAFVRHYDEAFDPRTFLYFEEHILWMRCRIAGLTMHYDPRIVVRHVEDASTDQMKADTRRKMIFTLGNYVKSLNVLDDYVR